MKLTLIQMNSDRDRDANVEHAGKLIDRAVDDEGSDLVVLPEFFNHRYIFQYHDYSHMSHAETEAGVTISRMREKAKEHGIHVVATIYEEHSAGVYFDTAFVLDPDGHIVGKYRKTHPAAVRSLEKIFFRYGSHFPIFRIGEWRVGINICYDTLFPESARCSTSNGAELILVPFAAPAHECWREMMMTRAHENGVYFAPCNKVGPEKNWVFGGNSMIVAPDSTVIASASGSEEDIITADLSRDVVYGARRRWPMLRDRRPDLYSPICSPTEDILLP